MKYLSLVALFCVGCSGSSPLGPSTPTMPSAPVTPTLPIGAGTGFDPVFWKEFVHDGYEQPSALMPLKRLTAAPMLYLKTVDEAGHAMDANTLDIVEAAFRGTAASWSGGQFGLAGVQRGTGTMAGLSGWITVIWPNPSAGNFCGLTLQPGADGGTIELNYLSAGGCACPGTQMRPFTARHELGHAFGYWHTDNPNDVMYAGHQGCGDLLPSAREVYHAQVAYQNPNGTTN